jgi:hypothetical protein
MTILRPDFTRPPLCVLSKSHQFFNWWAVATAAKMRERRIEVGAQFPKDAQVNFRRSPRHVLPRSFAIRHARQ